MSTPFKSLLLSSCIISSVYASGWKIPEQSVNSTATAGSYAAYASGADAAYYNPANISFNENHSYFEADLTYIHLSSVHYTDNNIALKNSTSATENFFIPTLFYSSGEIIPNLRLGVSFTAPGGLAKRWESGYAKAYAQEFSLRIVELNPSISYKLTSNFSLGLGARIIYSDGIVKSDSSALGAPSIARDMPGDEIIEYGYNLALAYKPTDNTNVSLTYRSNVNLTEKGTADLYFNNTLVYSDDAQVTVPLPATLVASYAHTFDNTTFEFSYEKTYWSKYQTLDFEYDTQIPAYLYDSFDAPKTKNWKNTTAYRVGLYHQLTQDLELMAGFALDEAPNSDAYTGFELPDSDSKIFSLGSNYDLDDDSSIGFAYLYDKKEDRTIINTSGIDGEFSNTSAHLVSFAYRMSF